jgi:hypothetical protein
LHYIAPGPLREDSVQEGKGKEGKGKEGEGEVEGKPRVSNTSAEHRRTASTTEVANCCAVADDTPHRLTLIATSNSDKQQRQRRDTWVQQRPHAGRTHCQITTRASHTAASHAPHTLAAMTASRATQPNAVATGPGS